MGATIDRDALKAKYAEERDKRRRPDGNDQSDRWQEAKLLKAELARLWASLVRQHHPGTAANGLRTVTPAMV